MSNNHLHAFFYMHLGEQMPNNALDEWFLAKEEFEFPDLNLLRRGVNLLIARLQVEKVWTEEEIQFEFYEVAKEIYGKENIREFFKLLYLLIFDKESGPRWGQFVYIIGISLFVVKLQAMMEDPIMNRRLYI